MVAEQMVDLRVGPFIQAGRLGWKLPRKYIERFAAPVRLGNGSRGNRSNG